ncbi:MAG TPA: translocation/assembly module TamB domain-containing protein, partial [Gammaproteobacteria bacterium]|nr:translocation/assembly module TamB domain-containing protein [Gammaproteobacteria bacterium]
MRLRIVILAAIGVLVVLGAGLVSAGYWLLARESGADWIVARVAARIPLRVSIGELSGTVLGGLHFRNVVVEIGSDRLEIDEARLELDLTSAIGGSLRFGRLSVSTATYLRGPAPQSRSPRAPLNVPLAIRVVDGSLQRFVFVGSGGTTELGPVSLAAHVLGDQIAAEEVVASALGFDLNGSAELRVAADLAIDTDFAWSTVRDGIAYSGEGRASGIWPELAFHQDVGSPVAVVAEGSVRLGADLAADFDASWRELSWPGFELARSPQGSGHFSGWLNDYAFSMNGTLVVEGIETEVVASGFGTLEGLEFTALQFSGEPGDIDAAGRLAFAPVAWSFDIATMALNPAVRLPDWPGALDVRGELSGTTSPQLELQLRNMSASGELRALPIAASGDIGYRAPGLWQFDGFVLASDENQLSLTGTLGEAVSLDVAVDARRLDRLMAEAAGALHAAGRVAGTLAEPVLTGVVNGWDLHYGDLSAQTLTVSGEIVADESGAARLDLGAEGLTLRGRPVDTAMATVSGTAAQHVATLVLSADEATAELRAAGSWAEGTWSGELTALELEEPAIGAWELVDTAPLELGRGRFELGQACLTQRETRLCSAARVGTDADALDVELDAFDLATLSPLLPSELALMGRYDASLHLTGPLQRPAGTFTARSSGTVVSIREPDEPALDIAIDSIVIDGDVTQGGDLRLMGMLQGASTGASVSMELAVARLWDADRTLRADILGRWEDLGMLSLLSPDIGDVRGAASIDLELEGPPRSPAIRGRAQLTNGRLEVPRWGLVVENIEADASSPDGERLLLRASGLAGDGRIEVTGETRVDAEAGWPTDLRVFGERLQAVRLPDAEILVSPALEVHAALPDISVTGAFLIPHARLRLEGLPPQAVRPSADTVVHGVERPDPAHPLNMHADIRVGLGDDVRYAGAGLDVALSGAMGLVYDSGGAAVASGAVQLSGEYQAYGQTLEIDEGQLLFTGPVANPNLDVR